MRRKKHSALRRVISITSIVCGLAAIGWGLTQVVPDFLSLGDYRDLASRVVISDKTAPDDIGDGSDRQDIKGGDKGGDGDSSDGDEPYSIDWDALNDEVTDAKAWVRVDNTDIDFPVIQGEDNDWYLYHDAFGRESYANVFLDYRADPNGRNAIIYAHTHWANTGFHQIAEVDEQWRLEQVGTVWYSTPEEGTLGFTPIAGFHVYPDFQDVQRFEFEANDEEIDLLIEDELNRRALAGEWNMATLAGAQPDVDLDRCVLVGTSKTKAADLSLWWVVDDDAVEKMRENSRQSVYHEWLRDLVSKADSSVAGAQDLAAASERCLVLGCCSWPFDSHRTLLVCVR